MELKLKLRRLAPGFQNKGNGGESRTVVGNFVYCFGGMDSEEEFGAIFNTNTFRWYLVTVPVDVEDRRFHAAVLVEDKIYFHGGVSTNSTLSSFTEFDTVLETFREIYTPPEWSKRRSGATAVYASWRKEIIFFGGLADQEVNRHKNDIFLFNVDTMAWSDTTPKGKLPPPRSAHTALLDLYNMYIFGGWGGRDLYLNDLWVADVSQRVTITWTMVKTTGITPAGRSAACLNKLGDAFVVFGGLGMALDVEVGTSLFFRKSREWAAVPGEKVQLNGRIPRVNDSGSVGVADGILYFTSKGVFKLTEDS